MTGNPHHDSKGRFASKGSSGSASKKKPKLDAWGRPRMENFPTGVRHELGTNAPVRWTQPKKKKRKT